MPHFGDYQNEIYVAGLSGRIPPLPIRFEELETKAHAVLPKSIVSYVAGGCGNERTQAANVTAFDRWGLVPRMLVGAAQRDMSIDLFGMKLPSPLFMCPIGVIGICAQDGHGDIATARAAARTGVPMIASTLTVDPLEQVAKEFGATPGFFQLYAPTDRELAESLVKRAEAAGFRAIVVTLDTWITGWRPRDLGDSNFPQLRGFCLANYFSDPRFLAMLGKSPNDDPAAAIMLWVSIFGNPLTWDDLPWLRSLTKLPLLVRVSVIPTTCDARSMAVSTESIAPTTAAGRRMAALPRSTCCQRWWKRPARYQYCSIPACVPALTSSRH